MCGIVGGISNANITPLLLEGLKRLEYRGYDSSGIVVYSENKTLDRQRAVGKVFNLENKLKMEYLSISGFLLGIPVITLDLQINIRIL